MLEAIEGLVGFGTQANERDFCEGIVIAEAGGGPSVGNAVGWQAVVPARIERFAETVEQRWNAIDLPPFDEHFKLVAAGAVAAAGAFENQADLLRAGADGRISGLMAALVVDLFEIVDVKNDDGEGFRRLLEHGTPVQLEGVAVVHASHAVFHGESAIALGDVFLSPETTEDCESIHCHENKQQ